MEKKTPTCFLPSKKVSNYVTQIREVNQRFRLSLFPSNPPSRPAGSNSGWKRRRRVKHLNPSFHVHETHSKSRDMYTIHMTFAFKLQIIKHLLDFIFSLSTLFHSSQYPYSGGDIRKWRRRYSTSKQLRLQSRGFKCKNV